MIVEDEINILKYMEKKLSRYEDFKVEAAFPSAEEALESFEYIKPDVVFLDIEMPRINGIDLARKFLSEKYDVNIIFTTAYEQYAIEAFGVEAIDYLMKPINDDDILRVIKRLSKMENMKQQKQEEDNNNKTTKFTLPIISCLGKFQILDSESKIVKWPTRKAEEVFAYFVLNKGKYISKWSLLDLFWGDMDEERGLNNLYNTIYRIKQTVKKLDSLITIRKVNDSYIMEAEEILSDLDKLNMLMNVKYKNKIIDEMIEIFFQYTGPLFGNRDYFWSMPTQEQVARTYVKLCREILSYYREKNNFQEAEEVIRHYVLQHIEDESMMMEWLQILKQWDGYEEKVIEYKAWFNKKLKDAELPIIEEISC